MKYDYAILVQRYAIIAMPDSSNNPKAPLSLETTQLASSQTTVRVNWR